MAVYLSLTALVVALGMGAGKRDDVKLHMLPRQEQLLPKRRMTRQQALHIVLMTAVFFLLAGVSACRIAVGNDYWVYRFQFNLIMQGRHVSYEPGFNLVVWVLQSLFGYDNYLVVFGFFSIATCFFLVKALYDQAEVPAMSIFLLMTGGYYFSSLNSVRYYFVLAIALYAMKYVLQKRYLIFIAWIVFAAFFHKSILVVIPLYLLAAWLSEREIKRWMYVAAGVFLVSLIACRNVYREIIFFFYPFYEGSAFDTIDISYTNIAKCAGTLFLCLLYYKSGIKEHAQNRFYFFLNLMGAAVYTFGSFIPEVSRIGFYLIVTQIFLLPGVLRRIENKKWRVFWSVGVALAFLGYFALFLRSAYSIDIRLLPYRNWIFD